MRPKKIVIVIGAGEGLLIGVGIALLVFGVVSASSIVAWLLFKAFA